MIANAAGAPAVRDADWLCLAAAPAIAMMAVLTVAFSDDMPMICSTGSFPLAGMVPMSLLLGCFEPATTAASMAIDQPEAIDDAPARGPEHGGGRRRGNFLASRGVGFSPGKKVSPTPLRLRRSRRSRPSARSSHGEAVWSARRTASSGEDVADLEGLAQEARHSRRRERNPGVEKGRPLVSIYRADSDAAVGRCVGPP